MKRKRELPGFYFDEEKNRYFPISSRKEEEKPAESTSTSERGVHHSVVKLIAGRETGSIGKRFRSSAIEARCAQMGRSVYPYKSDAGIQIFAAEDGGATILLGGEGRLWRISSDGIKFRSTHAVQMFPNITSIKASPSRPGFAIVSTLGQGQGTLDVINVLAEPSIRSESSLTLRASLNSADYFPSGTKVAICTDIGLGVITSDVDGFEWVGHKGIRGSHALALKTYQDSEDNLLCCGYRNGRVKLVDLRDRTQSHWLFEMSSAVCSVLLPSNGFHIVTSALNGSVWLSDMRFPWKKPIFSFVNVNSCSNLQLAMDPTETILTSGGEDRAARFWSMKSGKLLHTERGFSSNLTAVHWPSEELAGKWVQGGPFFGCSDNLYQITGMI